MGSKSKIAKYIVPIIQGYIDNNKTWAYIEPFCGGCNVIDKIKAERRFAHDKNNYLIALFNNLQRLEELPKELTKEHYSEVRECYKNETGAFEEWYIGAIGFLGSYNGRFFDGGYSGTTRTKSGNIRNYYIESLENLKRQRECLQEITFICSDYALLNTQRAVIYCDPPYKNTKKYNVSKDFDYTRFWEWVRKESVENIVLVSENEAPEDFECIWERKIKRTINIERTKRTAERLFIYRERKIL